jgi:3-oxoacyl-[acyl-carrier protein] reductase
MNLKLDGKRALVTGASAGIGVAIGEALGREGARVLVPEIMNRCQRP